MTEQFMLRGAGLHPDHLRRLQRLDAMLRGEGMPRVAIVAELLGVDRRTIQRDLNILTDRYGATFERRKDGSRVYRVPELVQAPFSLTNADAFIVMVVHNALHQFKEGGLSNIAEAAYKKVLAAVMGSLGGMRYLGVLGGRRVNLPLFDLPFHPQVLAATLRAIMNGNKLEFDYEDEAGHLTSGLVLHPYDCAPVENAWYMIGLDDHSRNIRSICLERMRNPRLRADCFERPEHFDSHVYFANLELRCAEPQTITLRIARQVDPSCLSSGPQETGTERGSTITFTTSRMDLIKRWILSEGAGVEVLAPECLRTMVREECMRVASKYN